MSITTKEIPDGQRPLSRAELEAEVKEWKAVVKDAHEQIRELGDASMKAIIALNARIEELEAELDFVKQKFVYVYPEEKK